MGSLGLALDLLRVTASRGRGWDTWVVWLLALESGERLATEDGTHLDLGR